MESYRAQIIAEFMKLLRSLCNISFPHAFLALPMFKIPIVIARK